MDIINIYRNAYDAYIDVRAAWPGDTELFVPDNDGKPKVKQNAMLQAYDISAVLPFALGVGFYATDVWGENLEKYDLNSQIPLVIARNGLLLEQILETIAPLVNPDNQELIQAAIDKDLALLKKLDKSKKTSATEAKT